MILLTAARMPEGLDKDTLAMTVLLLFPSPENEEYIEKLRSKTHTPSACESLFALALVYEQLRELTGCVGDTSNLILARNKMGKPYFKDSDIRFNVSHSKGYVVSAVSVGEELGVDVEASNITPERAERFAKRYFSDQEQSEILNSPELFARKWTEKEARAKFLGKSVENILSQDKTSTGPRSFDDIYLHQFSIDGHPITLCTKRDFSTISFTVQ